MPIVNDVTQLNPVDVAAVVSPRSVGEVQRRVREAKGAVCIGGARHSQGGQTSSPGALFLDMRGLAQVLALDVAGRRVAVQAGITWRGLQQAIDPRGLAVRIMQDYANFTVGGTLSVNAHGSYVNDGPVVNSVESIAVVLADGQVVRASRQSNPDLFFGAIGGYGGLGVIVEVVLTLAQNRPLERTSHRVPVQGYRAFFETVKRSPKSVMHSAALYPPLFEHVNGVTFSETDKPLTVADRFSPTGRPSPIDLFMLGVVTRTDAGKWWREHVYDEQQLGKTAVVWRNYVASQDANGIEPASRAASTYVLQEYFIPVERFERFVPVMARILREGGANVLNIAIRHSPPETGTLLGWAGTEVFCFVLYYEQATTRPATEKVAVWTRALIAAALAQGGRYYLPYQIAATPRQFAQAYPRAGRYFALKRRLDPARKFRNRLLDAYDPAGRA